MSKVPFSISDRSLSFYVKGQPYSIDRNSPAWEELKVLVQSPDPDLDRLIALTNPVKAVAAAVEKVEALDYLPKGVVSVTRDAILYNGVPMEGVLIERIFDMLSEGFDIMPMVRFIENLKQNPGEWSHDELYLWMAASDLPITEDGYFLAYKKVRANFTSVHDGRTDNTPGTIVSMPREKVDKVRAHTCSTGLHFCSKSYLSSFGGDTIVLLKINPADVVSIPEDYGNAKGRAWKYEVLSTVEFDIPTKKWGAVFVPDAPDEQDDDTDLLKFPSDLAGALFAALTEIGIDVSDRDERIEWVNDIGDLDSHITSFKQLTEDEARGLIDLAREIKAEQDAESQERAKTAVTAVEALRRSTIANYGIVTLRAKAADAGWTADKGGSAWKGPKKAELVAYLVAKGTV